MGRKAHPMTCNSLDREVLLLKPALAVHGTQRLLTGRDQVLVVTLPCKVGYA